MNLTDIGALRRQLRNTQEQLNLEKARKMPNLGVLHRLERTTRKLQERIDKAWEETSRRRIADLRARAESLSRRSRIPPVNKVRRAKMREEQFSIKDGYHEHVRKLPCAYCGYWEPEGLRDPAHMLGVDLGGKAEHILPLCHFGRPNGPQACPGHVWQETHKLTFDELFEAKTGIKPLEMALAIRTAFLIDREAR